MRREVPEAGSGAATAAPSPRCAVEPRTAAEEDGDGGQEAMARRPRDASQATSCGAVATGGCSTAATHSAKTSMTAAVPWMPMAMTALQSGAMSEGSGDSWMPAVWGHVWHSTCAR